MNQEMSDGVLVMERPLHVNNPLLRDLDAETIDRRNDDDDDETDAAFSAVQYLFQPHHPEDCEDDAETLPVNKYIHKFRTAVLVVQVIRNLIKIYRDYAASRTEPISFSEYVGFETETENLLFDHSLFKAKMEMVLSSEAKQILTSPPEERTPDETKLAMLSLRMTVSSFAGYPVHIQEGIAKVGWYECFGPGRVIIRQGHVAQNFYLILSGTAVVTKVSQSKKTGEHFSKTVAFLKRGKYFGDVAILTNTKRNATVVCHDSVSLLAITRQVRNCRKYVTGNLPSKSIMINLGHLPIDPGTVTVVSSYTEHLEPAAEGETQELTVYEDEEVTQELTVYEAMGVTQELTVYEDEGLTQELTVYEDEG
ncbi:hypothetical protein GDO81_004644 [Engystomops pustulosus]|uniref:Cyclic nucleotide-binding domain-containing protein n=1 Tax=Engystomops pustulosus TaxID=76066 RepID=A0AAV7CJU6_ENGPU|nr:hypothetical protein GDO81_004644 [Engystomops pustulosus]